MRSFPENTALSSSIVDILFTSFQILLKGWKVFIGIRIMLEFLPFFLQGFLDRFVSITFVDAKLVFSYFAKSVYIGAVITAG